MSAARGRWKRRRREQDEAGAVAIITGVLMSFVLIAIAAFTVDLGMQRVVARDMQALSDAVALDLARLLDGRRRDEIKNGEGGRPSLDDALAASVLRNDTTTLGEDADCDDNDVVGYTTLTAVGTSCVYVFLVKMNADGTYPTVAGDKDRPQQVGNAPAKAPDGVVVFASSTVDFAFGLAASGSATRSAVGVASSTGCLGIGSYAARLDTENSWLLNGLLESILGGSIGVDLISYRGLADADVSLADLAVELGVGSVDQLAGATVGFDELLIAAADVLEKDGNTADANVLDTIAATVNLAPIAIGDLVGLTSAEGAAETATVNVFDLVTGSVLVADGTSAVAIPGLATELGLTGTDLTTSLNVIQGQQQDCGPIGETTVQNSQIDLAIDGTLASVPAQVLGLGLTVGDTSIDLSLAPAEATLTNLVCGDGTAASPSGIDAEVDSALLSAAVSQGISVHGSLTGGLLSTILPGLDSLVNVEIEGDIDLTVSTSDPGDTRAVSIRVPPRAYGEPVPSGSGNLALDSVALSPDTDLKITPTLLGLPIPPLDLGQRTSLTDAVVAALVGDVLGPLLGRLNTQLLTPLTELLGVSLGGADVFAVTPPECGDPQLVG